MITLQAHVIQGLVAVGIDLRDVLPDHGGGTRVIGLGHRLGSLRRRMESHGSGTTAGIMVENRPLFENDRDPGLRPLEAPGRSLLPLPRRSSPHPGLPRGGGVSSSSPLPFVGEGWVGGHRAGVRTLSGRLEDLPRSPAGVVHGGAGPWEPIPCWPFPSSRSRSMPSVRASRVQGNPAAVPPARDRGRERPGRDRT